MLYLNRHVERVKVSLIDLITNVHKRMKNVTCVDIGLSDFHDLVFFSTKQHVPTYRSYKNHRG